MKKTISVVSLLTLSLVSVSYASIDKNLKYGQRDKEVTELQEFLIDKGLLKTTPSNFFGLLTLKAVKAYQTSIGVSSTGFVGVLTREKINKEIDVEVASSNEAEKAEASLTTNTAQTNTQVTANTNTSTTSSDSIYDSNLKIDKLGRKVTITQDPNYKFLNIVRAKVDILGSATLTGFFYKDTKTFLTEADISLQQSITEDQLKKKAEPVNNLTNTQTQTQPVVTNNNNGLQTYTPIVQPVVSKKNISVEVGYRPTLIEGMVLCNVTAHIFNDNGQLTNNMTINFSYEDANKIVSVFNYGYILDATQPNQRKYNNSEAGATMADLFFTTKENKTITIDVPSLGMKKDFIINTQYCNTN